MAYKLIQLVDSENSAEEIAYHAWAFGPVPNNLHGLWVLTHGLEIIEM
jgi:hypothetical protein